MPSNLRVLPEAIVPQPVPDEHNSAEEIMAEWLRMYDHSEVIKRRLLQLARQLSEHITQTVEEPQQWKPPEPS
jgi:hypothetical protein